MPVSTFGGGWCCCLTDLHWTHPLKEGKIGNGYFTVCTHIVKLSSFFYLAAASLSTHHLLLSHLMYNRC